MWTNGKSYPGCDLWAIMTKCELPICTSQIQLDIMYIFIYIQIQHSSTNFRHSCKVWDVITKLHELYRSSHFFCLWNTHTLRLGPRGFRENTTQHHITNSMFLASSFLSLQVGLSNIKIIKIKVIFRLVRFPQQIFQGILSKRNPSHWISSNHLKVATATQDDLIQGPPQISAFNLALNSAMSWQKGRHSGSVFQQCLW